MAQICVRAFPNVGGVETHVLEVAPRLVRAGMVVTVLTTNLGGKLPPVEELNGVRIRRMWAWPPRPDYAVAPGIYRALTQEPWDIVHCQGYHTLAGPLAMLAARRARIPYIVSFHSGGHSSALRNALRPVQWAALRPLLIRASRLVAVSRFEASFFQTQLRLPASRIVLIPNGSNLPVAPTQPALSSDKHLIVSIGRLERYKGHHRVIAALPKVLATYPDARLRIVGSGPYEGSLRRLARDLRIADRVVIEPISGPDRTAMAMLLSRAGLVTLLSSYESQAIGVLEAIALGRRVLVSDTTALRELSGNPLVRAIHLNSSADDIAATIISQLDEPAMFPPPQLPSWDECAMKLLDLYRAVKREALNGE